MKYKKLGTTELNVSVICLGSMNWGQQNSEAEAHEQLDYATSRGINFIDTAEIYPIPPDPSKQGRTETYIGTWLAKQGRRDDLVIASKIAPSSDAITTRRAAPGEAKLTREYIRTAIEGTLKRLKTDYVDLYQVHWPERATNFFGVRGYEKNPADTATPIEEALEALSELVKEGKVRYLGVSNETPWGVSKYLEAWRVGHGERIASIQNQYSLINRTFEIGLSEFSLRENIPLLAYSPLSMGVLSGKYLEGKRPDGARFTLYERNANRYNPPRAQSVIAKYVALAARHGLDPAQMALAFVNSRPFVASNIIGATRLDQLKANIESESLVLSPEVVADISAIYAEHPDPTW